MRNPFKNLFKGYRIALTTSKRPTRASNIEITTSVPSKQKKRTTKGSQVISPSEQERVDQLMDSFDDGSL